ncbi:MAG TPA: MotA/TolQ/ExbB proton channel family protein [Polyangiaceae bacterium]|nr:MotA/TolQ/ExbB proton channel family protein [Polyangiaceae bacterium]
MLITSLEKFALMGATWVLYVLVAMSALSIGIIVERWFYFRARSGGADSLADALLNALKRGDRRAAEQLLKSNRSIEAEVLLPVLDWLDGGPESVSEALEASLIRKRSDLERGLTWLGTLGNNAPFLGLFGTVIGIIQAFHMLGSSGAGGNQAAMGNVIVAISEALIATGVGLVVALPAVVGYNLTQKRVSNVENNVQQIGKLLLALLKADDKLVRDFRALSEEPPASESELANLEDGVAVAEQPEAS